MAESIYLDEGLDRAGKYRQLLPQVHALTTGEPDLVANMANVCASLKAAFGFFWIGFYLLKEGELVLGPFQGPVACTRIRMGKGVCGHAAQLQQTVIVPDVDAFPGHIACSSLSKSEIVVPVFQHGELIAVLDVDSDRPDDFGAADQLGLEKMMKVIFS